MTDRECKRDRHEADRKRGYIFCPCCGETLEELHPLEAVREHYKAGLARAFEIATKSEGTKDQERKVRIMDKWARGLKAIEAAIEAAKEVPDDAPSD